MSKFYFDYGAHSYKDEVRIIEPCHIPSEAFELIENAQRMMEKVCGINECCMRPL